MHTNRFPHKLSLCLATLTLGLAAALCANPPQPAPDPTPTLPATNTSAPPLTPSPTPTASPSVTPTPTATLTETPSPTLTESPTPTASATPTPDVPQGIVKVVQAFCRYGPGTAYLHSHGLLQNDLVLIDGRNFNGTWLWVKPDNLDRHCWSAASNFDFIGDPNEAPVVQHVLPKSTFVQPPTGVEAARNGNQVVIDWDPADYIPVEDRRGYLLELYVCQNGVYFWFAMQTDNTRVVIQDDQNCSQQSMGLLYIAEKHGYSDPVTIPWP